MVRDNYNIDGSFIAEDSFKRTFKSISYRLGSSYRLQDDVYIYGNWGTGHDPVGSNIFLVNANENFDLTDIRQYEIGIKSILAKGNLELTSAYYDIERNDILLLVTHDKVGNSGSQVSRGIEFAMSYKLSDDNLIGGNFAYTDAEYKEFIDPDFGIDATGNTPPNVPKKVANLWFTSNNIYGLPIEIGSGLRYVGKRSTNFQNTATLKSYMLFNVFAAYSTDNMRFALNIRNLFDQDYAARADIFYPNQIALNSPRTFTISFSMKL